MSIHHWLNRYMDVWRPTSTPDGSGGSTVTYVAAGAAAVKVDQSTPEEQLVAAQAGAKHTHNVFTDPAAGIHRGDQLRDDTVTLHVVGTATPSTPVYLKLKAERVEVEP